MRLRYTLDPAFRSLGFGSCVVCELDGVTFGEKSEELDRDKSETLAGVLAAQEGISPIDAVVEGYRAQVAAIGRSAKKFPPAAETLLQLIRRTGRFPNINIAVDAYNITVCRSGLALGVHDLDRLGDTIVFRRSPGGERFRAVGSDVEKRTATGDYLYSDERRVLAWLDSKDSDEVKLSLHTRNVLIVIQGTSRTPREYTRAAIEDAALRIVKYCGGTFEIQDIE